MKVRFISQSTAKFKEEYITITDDIETKQEDFLIPGMKIDTDFIREIDLPSEFPMNYTFKREH
jgi:hypothetical protein